MKRNELVVGETYIYREQGAAATKRVGGSLFYRAMVLDAEPWKKITSISYPYVNFVPVQRGMGVAVAVAVFGKYVERWEPEVLNLRGFGETASVYDAQQAKQQQESTEWLAKYEEDCKRKLALLPPDSLIRHRLDDDLMGPIDSLMCSLDELIDLCDKAVAKELDSHYPTSSTY